MNSITSSVINTSIAFNHLNVLAKSYAEFLEKKASRAAEVINSILNYDSETDSTPGTEDYLDLSALTTLPVIDGDLEHMAIFRVGSLVDAFDNLDTVVVDTEGHQYQAESLLNGATSYIYRLRSDANIILLAADRIAVGKMNEAVPISEVTSMLQSKNIDVSKIDGSALLSAACSNIKPLDIINVLKSSSDEIKNLQQTETAPLNYAHDITGDSENLFMAAIQGIWDDVEQVSDYVYDAIPSMDWGLDRVVSYVFGAISILTGGTVGKLFNDYEIDEGGESIIDAPIIYATYTHEQALQLFSQWEEQGITIDPITSAYEAASVAFHYPVSLMASFLDNPGTTSVPVCGGWIVVNVASDLSVQVCYFAQDNFVPYSATLKFTYDADFDGNYNNEPWNNPSAGVSATQIVLPTNTSYPTSTQLFSLSEETQAVVDASFTAVNGAVLSWLRKWSSFNLTSGFIRSGYYPTIPGYSIYRLVANFLSSYTDGFLTRAGEMTAVDFGRMYDQFANHSSRDAIIRLMLGYCLWIKEGSDNTEVTDNTTIKFPFLLEYTDGHGDLVDSLYRITVQLTTSDPSDDGVLKEEDVEYYDQSAGQWRPLGQNVNYATLMRPWITYVLSNYLNPLNNEKIIWYPYISTLPTANPFVHVQTYSERVSEVKAVIIAIAALATVIAAKVIKKKVARRKAIKGAKYIQQSDQARSDFFNNPNPQTLKAYKRANRKARKASAWLKAVGIPQNPPSFGFLGDTDVNLDEVTDILV